MKGLVLAALIVGAPLSAMAQSDAERIGSCIGSPGACAQSQKERDASRAAEGRAWSEFKTGVDRAKKKVAMAYIASAECGLRSDRWFHAFTTAYLPFVESEANRLHISGLDLDDARRGVTQDELQSVRTEIGTCSKLVSSQAMSMLDGVEFKLTGGYH